MAQNFLNLMKNINLPSYTRISMNTKQDKIKEIQSQIYHNQMVKDKERTFKVAREKGLLMYKGSSIDCQLISHQTSLMLGGSGITYRMLKEKMSTKNSICSKIFLKMITKTERILCQQIWPTINTKGYPSSEMKGHQAVTQTYIKKKIPVKLTKETKIFLFVTFSFFI